MAFNPNATFTDQFGNVTTSGLSGDVDVSRPQLGSEFRKTGFQPDRTAFDQRLEATLAEFRAQIGLGREAVVSNAARRGVAQGGQVEERFFREVVAPVSRAVVGATAQAELEFQGFEAQQGIRLSQLDLQRFGIESSIFGAELSAQAAEDARQAQRDAAFGETLATIAALAFL